MDKQKIPSPKQDYKVLVKCNTYNQSAFILKAMQSFEMQLTPFPFVCLVMDDCSTDGERDVLGDFIHIHCEEVESYDDEMTSVIVASSRYNKNCTFAFYLLKKNLYKFEERKWDYYRPWQDRCQYEACCEGDDYWLSPTKLADQVRYLDSHPDFILIGSNGLTIYSDKNLGVRYFNNCHITREVKFEELVEKWFFPTASLLYRITLWDYYPKWYKEIHFSDDIIIMTCAIHGKVACLGDVTCAYRKGCGITSELDKHHIYMNQQHLLFYNHLLEDTGDKYSDCLKKKIKILEGRLDCFETKEKSKLLWMIKYPKDVLTSMITKITPKLKVIIKKIVY